MARRKSKGRGRSKGRRRGRRSAPKRSAQSSKRTIIVIKKRGRGSEQTTVYKEVYEEEW